MHQNLAEGHRVAVARRPDYDVRRHRPFAPSQDVLLRGRVSVVVVGGGGGRRGVENAAEHLVGVAVVRMPRGNTRLAAVRGVSSVRHPGKGDDTSERERSLQVNLELDVELTVRARALDDKRT